MPIGRRRSVAAVLLIHMLRKAALPRKPATSRRGAVPTAPMIVSASLRWSPQRSIAAAMRKPPRNRKMIGLEYATAVSSIEPTPRSGKSASGSRPVAGIGIASVIHRIAIAAPHAAVRQPVTSRPGGGGSARSTTNASGAAMRPKRPRQDRATSNSPVSAPRPAGCPPTARPSHRPGSTRPPARDARRGSGPRPPATRAVPRRRSRAGRRPTPGSRRR